MLFYVVLNVFIVLMFGIKKNYFIDLTIDHNVFRYTYSYVFWRLFRQFIVLLSHTWRNIIFKFRELKLWPNYVTNFISHSRYSVLL